ncbi:MAG: SDR family NAD(P)-dependent oxidoreductase [Heteroscytonema crispum UTEX LB 1556]
MPAIAIVGMACQYPDARSPIELWENVLAKRQAFRRIPSERLSLEDYWSDDRNAVDSTYATEAALIEGYEFDRVRFRVAGNTFRSADFVHWLALDVATQALNDAGFFNNKGLPNERTGVLVGNTLTGEFSRANTLRLRWPYVHRVVEATLAKADFSPQQRSAFLQELEATYKAPFPAISGETLAGNLSNTIAGRICNHYDLKGGGYTVDGACSSSLLAVANACAALVVGDLDVALVGGIDLSIDPFELIGFAKAGALASDEMRVYDTRSNGFWPGEGCGFVVLMRYEDAVAQHHQVYAVIRGWGISSDGKGGITRPEVEGQIIALNRAYNRAGFDAATVAYFEGHGTGTKVGDATELQVLSNIRQQAAIDTPPAVISSIKANIGHTKAAAGIAGLIKATMALHRQILPPMTGCEQVHPKLVEENSTLRILDRGELWSANTQLRAGVSAMGFGGINTHVVLEGIGTRRQAPSTQENILFASAQDAELLLMDAEDATHLLQQVEHLLTLAPKLSRSELTDLAAQLERNLTNHPVRAAIVTSTRQELTTQLEILQSWLKEEFTVRLDSRTGVFLGVSIGKPRIGFLFPGQASPTYFNGGAWERRFEFVQDLYQWANLSQDSDRKATAVAQPAIVTASMAALRVLNKFGIEASVSVGHSLGELSALHWAGGFDEAGLLRIATMRGQAMTKVGNATGAMASIQATQPVVENLINGDRVVIAGLNSPKQTVISGEATGVATVVNRAQALGLKAVSLPVSYAFHSPLVANAAQPLVDYLGQEAFQSLQRTVISTVTGDAIKQTEDLRSLLYRQVTATVRFIEAVTKATEGVDLFIEVGPGRVLSGLVAEFVDVPVVALDASGSSLKGLLQAIGTAFVLGTPVHHRALFADRFTRPFDLNWHPRFFVNPCELAPKLQEDSKPAALKLDIKSLLNPVRMEEASSSTLKNGSQPENISPAAQYSLSEVESHIDKSPLELIRQLVAERAELPISAIEDNHRLLSDLHLNSITVSQVVVEAARSLNLAPPVAPTNYANATVAEVAQALEELLRIGGPRADSVEERLPSGVDAWVRTFTVELVEQSLSRRQISAGPPGYWQVITTADHPLAEPLQEAFQHCKGRGVVVCLPAALEVGTTSLQEIPDIELLLEGSRAVLADPENAQFVLVQQGGGGAAFARTLYLEAPQVKTCIVNVPMDHPQAVEWILAEAKTVVGYSEAHYDASGTRREAVLRLLPMPEDMAEPSLGPDDVLLVTGGGKGIAAECALSLARETGVRLALLGRSHPDTDSELSTNLARMAAAGVQVQYVAADVTDADAVRDAVQKVEASLGAITAILHGAGVNVPQLLSSLDQADFLKTLAPKVQGIRNILAAVNPEQLRLLVTFGSIIARTGLPGEADYALANEWLAQLIEHFQTEHLNCRCLNVEWSIWSGVGMGDRLGRVDVLMQQGITPITPDIGMTMLRRLIAQPLPTTSVVVTGRFGKAPTLKLEQPELPFLRFLEQPRVHYPGVELVVDVDLSINSDPYLNDHVFQGEQVFPAVMGLEAMAQVAMALLETTELPIFEDVQFNRPVVVPKNASLKIRLAALVQGANKIEVVLRSEQTAFQVDHFRAVCWFGNQSSTRTLGISEQSKHLADIQDDKFCVSLDPKQDLYGKVLFHNGRFQRLHGYRKLRATECLAEIEPASSEVNWFSRYLPRYLVLGDPANRDAAIHALQACIPHATVLPIGVERFIPGFVPNTSVCFVYGREQSQNGERFIYDMEVIKADGTILERWEGLHLQIVKHKDTLSPWEVSLLAPYLERRIKEFIPTADVTVVIDKDETVKSQVRRARAIQKIFRSTSLVSQRLDGKPETTENIKISVAHADDLTLVIAGSAPIGCDVEPVVARSANVWCDLLGRGNFGLANAIAQEKKETLDITATRIWATVECLKKAGAIMDAPLVLVDVSDNSMVWLASGEKTIATIVVSVREVKQPLVFAMLVRKEMKVIPVLSLSENICHF